MKTILIALAALSLSSPAMAGGRTETNPTVKEAEHAANEAIKDAARCDRALAQYLKDGTNYDAVVFWCGL